MMTLAIPKHQPVGHIDKSGLALAITPRIRSAAHLDFVRRQRCAVFGCRSRDMQAHHLLTGPDAKARGMKASDRWTIPLCGKHHDALHANGNERAWCAGHGIDPIASAEYLWAQSPANGRKAA